MPDLGATDIVEITFEGKLDGQQTISTFHYAPQGIGGAFEIFSELSNFLERIRGAGKLYPAYRDIVSDQLTNLNVYAQVIYPIRYRYTNDGWADETGGVDALSMPCNVQGSITRTAERAGQRYTSHLALPALPVTAVENSFLTVDYLGDMSALAEQIKATIVLASGTEMRPCIFHPQFDPVKEWIKFTFPQATSRVQRRRTVGLGK